MQGIADELQRKGQRTPQAVRCNDRLCRATFGGTAVEVAESIPRRNPRRRRPRRQAASVPFGWPRTEEGERPAWLEPARSSQPKAGAARAQPEHETTSARCTAWPPRTRNRKRIFEICLACCIACCISQANAAYHGCRRNNRLHAWPSKCLSELIFPADCLHFIQH